MKIKNISNHHLENMDLIFGKCTNSLLKMNIFTIACKYFWFAGSKENPQIFGMWSRLDFTFSLGKNYFYKNPEICIYIYVYHPSIFQESAITISIHSSFPKKQIATATTHQTRSHRPIVPAKLLLRGQGLQLLLQVPPSPSSLARWLGSIEKMIKHHWFFCEMGGFSTIFSGNIHFFPSKLIDVKSTDDLLDMMYLYIH